MYALLTVLVLVLALPLWRLKLLHRNYTVAQAIKLPFIISPISVYNPFWIITYNVLYPPILKILQRLPIGKWPRCASLGWSFDDKHQLHAELGPVFVLCHPGATEVIVADPRVASHIFSKRKDFIKPEFIYNTLDVFGRNLDSVNGETWQRHRKITVPSFNERVSASVWDESGRQASQMLKQWTDTAEDQGTCDMAEDTASLALNVLTHAGFGKQYDFDDAKEELDRDGIQGYRDALRSVLSNFTYLAVVPPKVLKLPMMPQSMQVVGRACDVFQLHMKNTVESEMKAIENSTQDNSKANNLLGALVRASQAEDRGLTKEEIYGNMFIYNLAGHETTANAIATSIAYLVANPKRQDWLHEEIVAVLKATRGDWTYGTVWPQLVRCQATMLETLRLHGSVVTIPRATAGHQTLKVNGNDHLLPPNTIVTINVQGLHCDPNTWGSDALLWRPDRWIVHSKPDSPTGEALFEPEPGTFVPWADGPRICPGRKFSQVEFAAVMATLFASHRVRARLLPGETEAGARQRVADVIEDSTITAITLQMRRPRDVAFVWETR